MKRLLVSLVGMLAWIASATAQPMIPGVGSPMIPNATSGSGGSFPPSGCSTANGVIFNNATPCGATFIYDPSALTRPLEPVVTSSGTNDMSVGYRYVLVVHGAGTTAASAAMVNPFQGNATLSGGNYNIVQTVTQTGCTSIDVYRTQPGGLTTGLIGNVACGAALNDTGLTGNSQTATTSDTGSAGAVLKNPLVIVPGNYTGPFGGLQVGETPLNVPIGDNPGYYGPMAVFTASGTNNNGLVIQSASTTNDPGILFRNAAGTITNPVAQGAGAGWLAGENYVGGSINAWKTSTFIEFGNSGGTPTTLAGVQGRIQLSVANGNAGGYSGGSGGLTVKGSAGYSSPLNATAALLTNFTDFRQYRVGYAFTAAGDDTTNYERVDGTWASAGTTYNFGPVSGGTGTLRPMNFTGASIGASVVYNSTFNSIGNTSTDAVVLQNNTAAANNTQQWSPRLHFIGQSWKTGGTPASQVTDFIVEDQTAQGNGNGISMLVISGQNNGTGYNALASFVNNVSNSIMGILVNGGAFHVTNAVDIGYNASGIIARSAWPFGWGTNTDPSTFDTTLCRQGAGVAEIGTTACNASGSLLLTALTSTGAIKMTNLPTTTPGGTTSTMCWDSTAGALWTDTSATACGIVSALRFKNQIGGDPGINIAGLANLRVGPWTYKAEIRNDNKVHIGLLADDVEAMDSRCAVYGDDGLIKNYEDRCVLAYLVAANQNMHHDNDNLRAEFEAYRIAHP